MGETATTEVDATTRGLLNLDDPLWLRLWATRYHQDRPLLLAPISDEERRTHALDANPWPVAAAMHFPPVCAPPSGTPPGLWVQNPRQLRAGELLYTDQTRTLRVVDARQGRRRLVNEQTFLETVVSARLPSVLGSGHGWLMTTRFDGVEPNGPGPWLRDLRKFLHDLHTLETDVRPRRLRPRLSALRSVLGRDDTRRLDGLRLDARDMRPGQVPTHGELGAANLMVRDNLRLVGVVDFSRMAGAPAERDTAGVIVRLATLAGVPGLRQTITETPDPVVLAGEIVDLLELAARDAVVPDAGREARINTIRYLARALLEDPAAPAMLVARR